MLWAGPALVILSSTVSAIAQPTENKALAIQLFKQGRDLARANQWAEACTKFEASLRYDAALGTRLNLATCYEKIGRLTSAWGLFNESADLARQVGNTVWREYALKQIAALQPRLPKLTIAGPANPPPGFAVTRDGVAVGLGVLGTELYVDPGAHEVMASAPGFEQFKTTITVGESQSESVVIRELTPSRPHPPEPSQSPPEVPLVRAEPGRTRTLVGIGLAGGGAVLTGVGLFLGIRARSSYREAESLCGAALVCENDEAFEKGQALIDRARTQATISTVLVITGVVAAAGGAVVWIIAPRRERTETTVGPLVTDRDLGVVIMGRF